MLTPDEAVERFCDASFPLAGKCTRLDLRFHAEESYSKSGRLRITPSSVTHTSRGYMSAQEVTPEKDPQKKGTIDAGRGSHGGVGPCSPEGNLPIR